MLSIRENVESFYFTSPPGEDEEMSIAMQKVGEMQEGIQSCLQEATTKKILFPPLLLYLFPRRACWRCCRALRSPIEAAHDAGAQAGRLQPAQPRYFFWTSTRNICAPFGLGTDTGLVFWLLADSQED